ILEHLLSMNLSLLFDPVSDYLIHGPHLSNSFFTHINYHGESFPDLKGVQIALIGVTEARGLADNESMDNAASDIREKLYFLKKGQSHYKIADLGNLRPGVDLQETYIRIRTL